MQSHTNVIAMYTGTVFICAVYTGISASNAVYTGTPSITAIYSGTSASNAVYTRISTDYVYCSIHKSAVQIVAIGCHGMFC